jgi:hypothetical protein
MTLLLSHPHYDPTFLLTPRPQFSALPRPRFRYPFQVPDSCTNAIHTCETASATIDSHFNVYIEFRSPTLPLTLVKIPLYVLQSFSEILFFYFNPARTASPYRHYQRRETYSSIIFDPFTFMRLLTLQALPPRPSSFAIRSYPGRNPAASIAHTPSATCLGLFQTLKNVHLPSATYRDEDFSFPYAPVSFTPLMFESLTPCTLRSSLVYYTLATTKYTCDLSRIITPYYSRMATRNYVQSNGQFLPRCLPLEIDRLIRSFVFTQTLLKPCECSVSTPPVCCLIPGDIYITPTSVTSRTTPSSLHEYTFQCVLFSIGPDLNSPVSTVPRQDHYSISLRTRWIAPSHFPNIGPPVIRNGQAYSSFRCVNSITMDAYHSQRRTLSVFASAQAFPSITCPYGTPQTL